MSILDRVAQHYARRSHAPGKRPQRERADKDGARPEERGAVRRARASAKSADAQAVEMQSGQAKSADAGPTTAEHAEANGHASAHTTPKRRNPKPAPRRDEADRDPEATLAPRRRRVRTTPDSAPGTAVATTGRAVETDDAPARRLASKSAEFAVDFARLRELGYITPFNRRSRVSEEMRLIKRRLMQRMSRSRSNPDNPRAGRDHVILVTSARPAEGKSFTAINLALSIVLDEGLNVLLVDADVAKYTISRTFGTKSTAGLTDLLRDSPPDISDVLLRERNYPLTFLSAGNMVASATDLFGSPKMQALMDDIAERYTDRIIIFDAPPLLASTEPVVLAQHVGQIVFVIDALRTSRNAVESALDLLDAHDNVNLVLNKAARSNQIEQFGAYYETYTQSDE